MNWKDCIRRTLVAAAVIVALGCLSAQAQWGSIRANNRSVRGNRAPEATVSRGGEREHENERRPEVRREEGRPERRVEVEPGRGERWRPERHSDFDEDRRHSYFWSGISSGMLFNSLPSGYVPLHVGGAPYYYYGGAYYEQAPSGYVAVTPPIGAAVPALPEGAEAVPTGQGEYYYAGGAFYVQEPQGFVVVAPPLGVTVDYLPSGATPVYIRGGLYYQANGIYFMPVMRGGVTAYTTVQP
jgi:hypothetical protein